MDCAKAIRKACNKCFTKGYELVSASIVFVGSGYFKLVAIQANAISFELHEGVVERELLIKTNHSLSIGIQLSSPDSSIVRKMSPEILI